MRFAALLTGLGVWLTMAAPAWAENVVRLTSLDWPPYTRAADPHGAIEDVVRQAFKAVGYTLVVDYLPWNRAVENASSDPRYVGYFPEYASDAIAADFIFSAPVGRGPLGLAERKAQPVSWRTLDDLSQIPIGVVSGYVNTRAFDQRVADGRLHVDEAQSDAQNLRKLVAGRVRAVVIDGNVMTYLLRNDPDLIDHADSVQFNPRPFEVKDLFVCFRKDDKGREMAEIFRRGLALIDAPAIIDRALPRP